MSSTNPLIHKTALVTGASRGIGASVSRRLAEQGCDVVILFRSKRARADEVAAEITALGRRALVVQADITVTSEIQAGLDILKSNWGRLDLLILNASGGLEANKPPTYSMDLNLTAQMEMVRRSLPLMGRGSRIVFVTSHLAHFYGKKPVMAEYEVVAVGKKAGEDAVRAMIPELTALGIDLIVVSGDLIEGTITPKLLERARRDINLIEERRKQAGKLPDVEEFAAAIVDGASNRAYVSGHTIYVGAID